jgi:hypothetical protein
MVLWDNAGKKRRKQKARAIRSQSGEATPANLSSQGE